MAKKVYLSPSDQDNNAYAYGNTTEDVQCGKIATACKTALERNGVEVMLGQYDTMQNRCAASDNFGADLHVPIHTNASNGSVTGTRMFCSSTSGEGYKACKEIFAILAPITPGNSENISVNAGLFEVRTPSAPTAYIECEFHDNVESAKWIIEHTTEIGEAIAHGICNYFGIEYKTTTPKPVPTPATSSIKVGDVVKISEGATYYTGKKVPAWVIEKSWIVSEVNGDRAVIDKSNDGKNSICSPINVKFLTITSGDTTKPEAETFKSYLVKVDVPALNIRNGAGINFGVSGCIRDRGVYTIVAESTGKGADKGWGKLKSGAGWISLDFVTKM